MDPATLTKLRQSAVIIRKWLDRCISAHKGSACSASIPHMKPKRLVWLDPSRDVNRLVDAPSPMPEYVALSYVWGPTECNLRTLTGNVEQMYRNISLADLPLTLQHVFQVVRYLDIHYLWIDTLCIVQDDEDEKAVEIGRMEFVYLNATLQISAMASPSARHGLLQTRQYLPAQRDEHHLIMKACRSLRQRVWDEQLQRDYCLLTRGWAYQERMLSRRIVHFTVFELLWECKQARWCECGMVEQATGSMTNMINNMSAAFEACAQLEAPRPEQIVPFWRECVMGYSRGHLTVKTDRLPAISGVGRMLGGRDGEGSYVAGMRRDGLPFELLWRCDQSSKLPRKKTRRPSWSWGSVDCGVDWPANDRKGTISVTTETEKSLAHVVSGTYFEEGVTGVEIVELDAKPMEPAIGDIARHVGFGRVEYAKLGLAARTVPVSIRRHHDPAQWRESHGTEWAIKGRHERHVLPFYPDVEFAQDRAADGAMEKVLGSGAAFAHYHFLEIASIASDGGSWEAGLVVRCPFEGTVTGYFERVGMAGFLKCCPQKDFESWFEDAKATTIRLV